MLTEVPSQNRALLQNKQQNDVHFPNVHPKSHFVCLFACSAVFGEIDGLRCRPPLTTGGRQCPHPGNGHPQTVQEAAAREALEAAGGLHPRSPGRKGGDPPMTICKCNCNLAMTRSGASGQNTIITDDPISQFSQKFVFGGFPDCRGGGGCCSQPQLGSA